MVPVLLCFYLVASPKMKNLFDKPAKKLCLILLTIFLTTTLFFTFSRGAIYAFSIAFIAEVILIIIQNRAASKKIIAAFAIVIASFAVSLTAQGLFAAASSTTDTFYSGISKSIHQLSLGKIDFRPAEIKNEETKNDISENETQQENLSSTNNKTKQDNSSKTASENKQGNSGTAETSQFTGYVPESTEKRLSLNQIAIDTWRADPGYMFIGTGLGGAGVAMNQAFPDELGPKEIVQNEYVSLLLETGLVGYAVILAVVTITVVTIYRSRSKILCSIKSPNFCCLFPLFASTILAFAFTLFFFSGLPNAIHIYLFPIIFIGLSSAKNNTIIK